MRILIIGGTRFVGRHLVTAALARKHELTLFNRGTSSSTEPANVETIKGDRSNDLARLKGRSWDAVIDTCGYLPRTVKASAEVLRDSVDRYVFVSSVSAYADLSVAGIDETAPLASLTSAQLDEANAIDSSARTSAVTYGALYGGLKSFCERELEEILPNRLLIIRPGLIVGPDDYTDRFTYWVMRVSRGGELLAPGPPERTVQFIDARDLAEWTIRMIERKRNGIYNAIGLPDVISMKDVLEECKRVSQSDASFTWASEEFLISEKIVGWSELPLWLPDAAHHLQGLMHINCDKAVAAGLSFRPIKHTIRDTLAWRTGVKEELKAGLDPDREIELLRKLHMMQDSG